MSWNVDYARAFLAWVGESAPSDARMTKVQRWTERAIEVGPPDDSVQVGGLSSDLYVAPVRGANLRATFLAIAQDRCMIVKSFR